MPDTPWPLAGLITAIGLVGFVVLNHVDQRNHLKWGWPWWTAIPVTLLCLAVSYRIVAWIQGLKPIV